MKKTIFIAATCIYAFAISSAYSQTWRVIGNAGTTPATNFIGTTDNVTLNFRTNNLLRMSIDNTGNVGIGTATPAAKLDVIGQLKITDGSEGAGKVLTSDGAGLASWETPVNGADDSWSKLGNAGTVDGVNFLGTTDNVSLNFRVNNQKSGSIDIISYNAFFGYQAGLANIMGSYSVGVGHQALLSNVVGAWNVAIGYQALKSITGSNENIAIGAYALSNNITGRRNVAIGHNALASQTYNVPNGTWDSENVAIGYEALFSNNGIPNQDFYGATNTAVGTRALRANTSGYYNVAIGSNALLNNTTGAYNTAIGKDALFFNTTANNNTAIGTGALYYNTIGFENTATGRGALYFNSTGNVNVANGEGALYYNTTGGANTAIGHHSLNHNTTGVRNTAVGNITLNNNTTGNSNTAIGTSALIGIESSEFNTGVGNLAGGVFKHGYNNVFLGANTGTDAEDYYNVIACGQGTIVLNSNTARFGNASTSSYGGWANWTNVSDGRFKNNIKENVPGLAFIEKLRPVTYTLDASGLDAFMHKNVKDDMSAEGKAVHQKALQEKEKITYTGFLAQEVEASAKELGFDFSGVDAAKSENDVYGLRYAEFVVPLVKAVQEMNAENTDLKSEVESLKNEIENLKVAIGIAPAAKGSEQSAILFQNSPNPFSEKTTIKYYIPESAPKAEIKIYDSNGREQRSFVISEKGNGQIEINGNSLLAGIYNYILIVDGKAAGQRQMILTK